MKSILAIRLAFIALFLALAAALYSGVVDAVRGWMFDPPPPDNGWTILLLTALAVVTVASILVIGVIAAFAADYSNWRQ